MKPLHKRTMSRSYSTVVIIGEILLMMMMMMMTWGVQVEAFSIARHLPYTCSCSSPLCSGSLVGSASTLRRPRTLFSNKASPLLSASLQSNQNQHQHNPSYLNGDLLSVSVGDGPPQKQQLRQQQQQKEEDSIERYAQDITTVLTKLRSSEYDPAIPRSFHRTKLPSFTRTWSLDDWNVHKSRSRYVTYLRAFPTSRLLHRIAPQMLVVLIWSIAASWMCSREVRVLKRAVLPLSPLSLVSTFVAALLTLRSNQGLSRLNEGRQAFGKVVLYTREMALMIAATIYPKDKALGLLAARHVAIFPWLMKGFLRGDKVNGSDQDLIQTMLPSRINGDGGSSINDQDNILSPDAAYVLQQRKKPVAVVTRLRQIFAHMHSTNQLTTSEASRLDSTVQHLDHCIMVTERIQASPIPPLYTAHTGRLLMFYLFFLPLALRGSNMLNTVGTVITSAVVGYAMLGLDEISHLTEEPFRLMPLWHLSKNSMQDCGDAIVCRPPALYYEDDNNNNERRSEGEEDAAEEEPVFVTPSYW